MNEDYNIRTVVMRVGLKRKTAFFNVEWRIYQRRLPV